MHVHRRRFVAVNENSVVELQRLVAALGRSRLVHQFSRRQKLRVHTEADGERLADCHQRQSGPAHEVRALIHRRLARQEDVLRHVGQVRDAIDLRREHRDGLEVILRRQVESGDFQNLIVAPAGNGHFRFQVVRHARAVVARDARGERVRLIFFDFFFREEEFAVLIECGRTVLEGIAHVQISPIEIVRRLPLQGLGLVVQILHGAPPSPGPVPRPFELTAARGPRGLRTTELTALTRRESPARADGHFQRPQVRRRGTEHRLGRRERQGHVVPRLARPLADRGEVLDGDGVFVLPGAEFVLRPPTRVADEVIQLDRRRTGLGLVHGDDCVAFRPHGSVREFAHRPFREDDLFLNRVHLLLEGRVVLDVLDAGVADEVGEGDRLFAVEVALFRQRCHRRGGEGFQLTEELRVLFGRFQVGLHGGQFFAEFLDLGFRLPDVFAAVFRDGPGPVADTQHPRAVASLRVQTRLHRRGRERRDDHFPDPRRFGQRDFARDEGRVRVHGHGRDFARGDRGGVGFFVLGEGPGPEAEAEGEGEGDETAGHERSPRREGTCGDCKRGRARDL